MRDHRPGTSPLDSPLPPGGATRTRRRSRARSAMVSAGLLVGLFSGTIGVLTVADAASTRPAGRPMRDTTTVLVRLAGDPVTVATGVERGRGQRVDLRGPRTRAHRAMLAAQRNTFRSWLRANAPAAQIGKSYDLAVHAVSVRLNGTRIDTLRLSPQVLSVEYVRYYRPTNGAPVDPDLALINAVAAWGGGGSAGAGSGVKVGIIDSGIEQDHDCFDDMGDRDGPSNFTNNKVIVAKVFHMQAAVRQLTAEAVESHGTHVAGTVACDVGTTAVVDGVTMPHTISGVAPAAMLGNYNVFPGTVESARSEDILDALEAAYADGMHVINMSLGGGASGIQDLLTIAVDNFDRGGMLSAVSAGNEGPGFSTVGSPGSAARALTAGASAVPHIVSGSISTSAGSALAVSGDFGAVVPGDLGPIDVVEGTGPAGVSALADVSLACSAIPSGTGVAVIARGVCDFSVKIRNVQSAGYAAAIVINRERGVFVMGTDGAASQPTIPAVMIDLLDADVALDATGNVTFVDPQYYDDLGNANEMADFSSEGPTDVDRRVKPDLVAPGVHVLSSVVGGEFAFYNGTSMAAPHLAGAAAVVLSQHPSWAPWQVRSAITNTADATALVPYYDADTASDPNLTGAGLLDLEAAVSASALVAPVSTHFGSIPRMSGTRATRTVTVQNLGGALTAHIVGSSGGAVFAVSSGVDAMATGTITVTATVARGAMAGHAWATVELRRSGTVVAHFRVYVLLT